MIARIISEILLRNLLKLLSSGTYLMLITGISSIISIYGFSREVPVEIRHYLCFNTVFFKGVNNIFNKFVVSCRYGYNCHINDVVVRIICSKSLILPIIFESRNFLTFEICCRLKIQLYYIQCSSSY